MSSVELVIMSELPDALCQVGLCQVDCLILTSLFSPKSIENSPEIALLSLAYPSARVYSNSVQTKRVNARGKGESDVTLRKQ